MDSGFLALLGPGMTDNRDSPATSGYTLRLH
jgi:hypothetical protein